MIGFIQNLLPVLYGFYNSIFQPLLAMGPYLALGTFSAALALVFSLIYKVFLNVERQQEIKDKISDHQEKMKEARKNDEEDKASKQMKKTLELNQKMMMLNFKPMIATMVFVALIFPWLGSTFAPTVELEEQGNNTFTGELEYAGQAYPVTVENNSEAVLKMEGQEAGIGETIELLGMDWDVMKFTADNGGWFSTSKGTTIKLGAIFIPLPFSIPLAGEALHWLGFYILIAMPLTFIFRKLLGVS